MGEGCLSVVSPAEASKEEKWPQPADPEVQSRSELQTPQPDCILPHSPIQAGEGIKVPNGISCQLSMVNPHIPGSPVCHYSIHSTRMDNRFCLCIPLFVLYLDHMLHVIQVKAVR